jgi:hypothetical protein
VRILPESPWIYIQRWAKSEYFDFSKKWTFLLCTATSHIFYNHNDCKEIKMKKQIVFFFVVSLLAISLSTARADVKDSSLMGFKFGMKIPEIVEVLNSKYAIWEECEYVYQNDTFYIEPLDYFPLTTFSVKEKNTDLETSPYILSFVLIEDFGLVEFVVLERPEGGINSEGTLNAMINKFGQYNRNTSATYWIGPEYLWYFGINGEKDDATSDSPCDSSFHSSLSEIKDPEKCGQKIMLIMSSFPLVTKKPMYMISTIDLVDYYKYAEIARQAYLKNREKNIPDL